jgi:hypothetical protein
MQTDPRYDEYQRTERERQIRYAREKREEAQRKEAIQTAEFAMRPSLQWLESQPHDVQQQMKVTGEAIALMLDRMYNDERRKEALRFIPDLIQIMILTHQKRVADYRDYKARMLVPQGYRLPGFGDVTAPPPLPSRKTIASPDFGSPDSSASGFELSPDVVWKKPDPFAIARQKSEELRARRDQREVRFQEQLKAQTAQTWPTADVPSLLQ